MATLTKSNVWNPFTKINENECTCNICEEVVKVKQGSTTNLHNHLKRRHGKSVELCTPKSQKRKYNDEKLIVGTMITQVLLTLPNQHCLLIGP